MRPLRRRAFMVAALVAGGGVFVSCAKATPTVAPPGSHAGPPSAYACKYDVVTDAFTGADATASAIGWEGNHQGVVTCLGGAFYVQDGIDRDFGFGIYDGSRTTWTLDDGYLPAQVTTFRRGPAAVSITEFADKVDVAGRAYVAVYSRVSIRNPTGRPVSADPSPSRGLLPLDAAPITVAPHASVVHDYVVAVDRFGKSYAWPSAASLTGAGGFATHFAHMRAFWNAQLAEITRVAVPDTGLDNAYKSGFIYTQIARSGDALDTGVNGYQAEFSHDVIGILANLFTQGYFSGAHALLTEARNVVGAQAQYQDGLWTYAWPWAIYLMKTGDLAFVKANFATPGPRGGVAQPSIEETAHAIAADRTGPAGIMGATNDIDTQGYWTIDDYEALMGLAAYRYLAERVGDATEAHWASGEYDSLLAATNATLDGTITANGLTYLPCSMLQPNTADRCDDPRDANWAAPFQFGKWAWDAPLFGAAVSGPGVSLIDATYDYGFGRLSGSLPAGTFGGFPPDFYSTAYNAAYGSWGLASADHRDQGILSYGFMLGHSQSGPDSWWESASSPSTSTPWVGSHPAAGQGSSPHAWGMAEANKVLLDSLVAQRSDGSLIVGRGVPSGWLDAGKTISVANFPTTAGHRLSLTIASHGRSVSLTLGGQRPAGQILFELPAFVGDIASASAGTVDDQAGTVTVPAGTRSVTVELDRQPG